MVEKAKATNIVELLGDSQAFQSLVGTPTFGNDAREAIKNMKTSQYNTDSADTYSFGSHRSFQPSDGIVKAGNYETYGNPHATRKPRKHHADQGHSFAKNTQPKPKDAQLKTAKVDSFTQYRPGMEESGFGSGRHFNPDLGGTIKVNIHDKKADAYAQKINQGVNRFAFSMFGDRKGRALEVSSNAVATHEGMKSNKGKHQPHKQHLEPSYRLAFNPDTGIYKEVVKG